MFYLLNCCTNVVIPAKAGTQVSLGWRPEDRVGRASPLAKELRSTAESLPPRRRGTLRAAGETEQRTGFAQRRRDAAVGRAEDGAQTTEDGRTEAVGRNPLPSIRNAQSDNSAAGGRRLPGAVPEIELTACRRRREEAVQGAGMSGPVQPQGAADSDASARLRVRSHVPGTRRDRAQADEAGIRKAKP